MCKVKLISIKYYDILAGWTRLQPDTIIDIVIPEKLHNFLG